jgi:hypothetical protein
MEPASDLAETPSEAQPQERAESASPVSLDEIERVNARPCGDDTIAVVTDARNNQYVFCAMGDGRVGVIESTWDPGAEQPLSDRISDPVELLSAVVGDAAEIPSAITNAVRVGTAVKEPFVFGKRKADFPRVMSATECDFDTFRNAYCGTGSASYWNSFASQFVDNSSPNPDLDCAHKNMFCSDAGWHQRTASEYQANLESGSGSPWGGACAGKARVISCGGSTLFNTYYRETAGSGTWTSHIANYWIAENSSAVWIYYGNAAHSCAPGSDVDDMRSAAQSEPGAYHNYSLIYIKWVDDSISCDPT